MGTCGVTGWRETGHCSRGWKADSEAQHLSTSVALIGGEHLITFNLIKAMKSGFSHSLVILGLLSFLMLPLAGLSESADLEKGITQRNLVSL